MSTGNISLTKDDLKEIVSSAVAAAVEESRKPLPLTPGQQAEVAMAQENRADIGRQKKEENENKLWFQTNACTHEHSRQAGGGTHAVFVRDNDIPDSPGYIYCQKCEARFRPDEPRMKKLDPKAIFNTQKFNELLQSCVTSGAEMFG